MELLQLTYFCDAAVTENFSRTAGRFLVPPSGISQSVKRLEKELGVALFEHHSNKVTLTEAGRRFYEATKTALGILEEAKDALAGGHTLCGDIRLLILCNRRMVTAAIEACKADYPEVHFTIRHEQDSETDFDLVISDSCPTGYTEADILVEEQILLAMSADHPLAKVKELQPQDLQGWQFITMPKGRSLYHTTMDIGREAGFWPDITIQTDDPYYVRKYVELGLGIAFFPACSWHGLFSENVVTRQVGNYRRRTGVYLPKHKKPKAAVEEFFSYLQKYKKV